MAGCNLYCLHGPAKVCGRKRGEALVGGSEGGGVSWCLFVQSQSCKHRSLVRCDGPAAAKPRPPAYSLLIFGASLKQPSTRPQLLHPALRKSRPLDVFPYTQHSQ
jgi:hypothetical protein